MATKQTKAPETKAKAKGGIIELPPLQRGKLTAYIIGETPLIVHAWSKKARLEMLAKMMGQKLPRYHKSPVQDFLDSIYHTEDGAYGFPATGIKKAMVSACTSMSKEITKVAAQQAFFVESEVGSGQTAFANLNTPMQLVRIHSPNPPAMREDGVRLNGRSADLRYRAQFWPWAMTLEINFNSLVVSQATIVNLLDTAGFAVGLGEWRQEKTGTNGAFRGANPAEMRQIDAWAKAGPKPPVLVDEKAFLAQIAEDLKKYGEATPDDDGDPDPGQSSMRKGNGRSLHA